MKPKQQNLSEGVHAGMTDADFKELDQGKRRSSLYVI